MIVVITLRDLFNSVIVPRATTAALRASRFVIRFLWSIWPRLAYRRYGDSDKREDFLGAFAPFALMSVFLVWVVLLIAGWGLFFYGIRDQLRPHPFIGDAFYYAGAAVLSAGVPEMSPATALARAATLLTAASGFTVLAVVISFLFAIFASFQRREIFVVTVSSRSGTPPSGTGILAVHNELNMRSALAKVFHQAQDWTAELMENHLAYPILIYFRSSHDYQSWVGTLGALLDASVLLRTTVQTNESDAAALAEARIFYDLGRHLTHDFSHYFDFVATDKTAGIDRREFDAARDRLRESGYALIDADAAWDRFCAMRSAYAGQLNAMARWLEIPPVQWIGDRSVLSAHFAG